MIKEKNLNVCILLEYYGNMLTDRQREVIELYYDEDLSLQEISEHVFITRQGVRDLIVRGERVLFELEEKLGLTGRFAMAKKTIDRMQADALEIRDINNRKYNSREIADKINAIRSGLEEIKSNI